MSKYKHHHLYKGTNHNFLFFSLVLLFLYENAAKQVYVEALIMINVHIWLFKIGLTLILNHCFGIFLCMERKTSLLGIIRSNLDRRCNQESRIIYKQNTSTTCKVNYWIQIWHEYMNYDLKSCKKKTCMIKSQ